MNKKSSLISFIKKSKFYVWSQNFIKIDIDYFFGFLCQLSDNLILTLWNNYVLTKAIKKMRKSFIQSNIILSIIV